MARRQRRKLLNPVEIVLPRSRSVSRKGGGKALPVIAGVGVLFWFISHADENTLAHLLGFGLLIAASAGVMFWIKRTSQVRAKRALITRQQGLASIALLTWSEFEEMVAELYRQRGFEAKPRVQGGPDGGVDIVLERNGELTLVQCKHWKSTTVGASVVREMMGLIVDHRANAGKIVCSGKFTRQAIEFSKGKPIELVNGEALWSLIEETKRTIGENKPE